MPFDPISYTPPSSPPPREPPKLSPAGERIILFLVGVMMLLLLILPFSVDTFVDIIRYARGG